MNCPRCNHTLSVSYTHSVEVDYCPNCRGVWLDRGELDKIIERSQEHGNRLFDGDHHEGHYGGHHEEHHHKHNSSKHGYNDHHHRGKRGFLADLFDF